MQGTSDESASMLHAQWLCDVARGARSDGEDELRQRVSASLRHAEGWDDVAALGRYLAGDDLQFGEIRPDGDAAVIEVRTPQGLELERLVRVDGDDRVASITTRLAGGASMTMVSAAAWRGAHLAFDDPIILQDTLAAPIVGDASPYQADAVRAGSHGTTGFHYRWNMAARSRYAEDTLADRRAGHGVRQYVLLGAGLDTFALRNPFDDVIVYEVDTPASQGWKLDRLAQMNVASPHGVRYVSCDFEQQDFVERLVDAGFDPGMPAVAAWLGVSYYLTEEAIRATLGRVGAWPAGSAIVFDYVLDERRWDEFEGFDADAMRAALAGVAAAGEPFLSLLDDDDVIDRCRSAGFTEVELLGHDDMRARFMPGRDRPVPGPDPVLKLACGSVD